MDRETVEGVVHDQIANPRRSSAMPADLVTGDDARDVAAYVALRGRQSRARTRARSPRRAWPGRRRGEQIFTAAGCGGCHTLAKAGTNGNIGPSLDDLATAAGEREPGTSARGVRARVALDPDAFTVEGFDNGVMPSYEGRLTDEQVQALVEYLLQSGGGSAPRSGAAARQQLGRRPPPMSAGRLAVEVRDHAAGLLYEQAAGRPVPGLEAALVEGVDAAGGEPGQVERGGAGAADVAHAAAAAADHLGLLGAPGGLVGEAGGHHRPLERAPHPRTRSGRAVRAARPSPRTAQKRLGAAPGECTTPTASPRASSSATLTAQAGKP